MTISSEPTFAWLVPRERAAPFGERFFSGFFVAVRLRNLASMRLCVAAIFCCDAAAYSYYNTNKLLTANNISSLVSTSARDKTSACRVK